MESWELIKITNSNKMKKINRYIPLYAWLLFGLGPIFFLIGYYEDYQIGFIKFGLVWKSLLLVIFLGVVFVIQKRKSSNHFFLGTAYFFKSLVYIYHSFEYFFIDFTESIKLYILPASLEALSSDAFGIIKSDFLKFMVIWTSLSCIPFFFGLQPYEIKDIHSLAIYGDADGTEFSGVFANKHLAAVTLACSLTILFHYFRMKILPKFVIVICSLSSFTALYLTYVRTGFLALFVGLIVYVLNTYTVKKSIVIISSTIVLGSICVGIAMELSPVFHMRMMGTNIYQEEQSADQFGSGRIDFWQQALYGPINEGIEGFLIGVGLEQTKDYMEWIIGLRIFSHNGFLDAYQTNGILGFGIFISYFLVIFRFIKKYTKGQEKALAYSLYYQMIAVQFVQGGVFFWYYILFSLGIGVCVYDKQKISI